MKNGEAITKPLRVDRSYTVVEESTLSTYILNKTPQTTTVEYNKVKTLTFINNHKLGNLKVFKVDKDNHKIPLGNVSFDVFSHEFQKVIGTYTTTVDGEILISDLRVRKLYIDWKKYRKKL